MEKGSLGMGIKIDTLSSRQKEIPEEFKDLAKDFAEKGFITTSTDNLITGKSQAKDIGGEAQLEKWKENY